MSQDKDTNHPDQPSREPLRPARQRRAEGDREAVAVPSNTATNNSNIISAVKVLRFGIDSLYLSYQGNLYPEIDRKLAELKKLAQSDRPEQQAKAQYKVDQHVFEVKDKGSSMFSYILEDNAFRIALSRPNKAVPMAFVKISSEYLTHKSPQDAEGHLYYLLHHFGLLESSANVSRVDMFVDFVSEQNMEAWNREAWVTRAGSVNSYAVDNRFTGWTIGLGGIIAARLYDKLFEIVSSNKGYLVPLWQAVGWQEEEPIWRLEFEFKRDFLKQKGLLSLVDVLANLDGLWSYATTEWLKLTIPNTEDQTRSRWPVHPMWANLASVDWQTSGGPLQSRFSNERVPSKQAVLGRGLSNLVTWMAIGKQTDFSLAGHGYFEDLYHYTNNLAMNIGTDLDHLIQEKVAAKARQFNTMDVQQEIYESDADDVADVYRKQSDGE